MERTEVTFKEIFEAGDDPGLVVSAVGLTAADLEDFEVNCGYPLNDEEKAGIAKLRAAILAKEKGAGADG